MTISKVDEPLDDMPEPLFESSVCGAVRHVHLPHTKVTLKCQYVEHITAVDHFAKDIIDGVEIIFRWGD